jgi:hypothetical protein
MLSFIKCFASKSDNVEGDNFEGDNNSKAYNSKADNPESDNNTDADNCDGVYRTDGHFSDILSEVQACLPHESLSCVVWPPRTTRQKSLQDTLSRLGKPEIMIESSAMYGGSVSVTLVILLWG